MEKAGHVLCVDDEPNILRSLQWLLRKKFNVETASSGQEALVLVKENDYDVIISDQRMPGMTGAEFLREARKISPRSMRLLLTGYSDMAAIVRSVNESEIYRFITKPWDMKALVTLTEQACKIAKSLPAPVEGDHLEKHEAFTASSDAILLLDDDTMLNFELEAAAGSGTKVTHTESLAEAVAILSDQKIGILISNTHVGETDVTGLIKIIKKNIPDLVCVVISDTTDSDMVIDLINQGQVYRFIPKPLKRGYIKLVIASAMHKRQLLKDQPDYAKRHSVDVMDAEQVKKLQAQIESLVGKSSSGRSGDSADGDHQFFQRVTSGLRRWFGAA
jgi:serine/threonine-protein kinase